MKRKGYPTRRRQHRTRRRPAAADLGGFGLGFITGLMVGSGFFEGLLQVKPPARRKGKVLKFERPAIFDGPQSTA
jgi:hypothetical protein